MGPPKWFTDLFDLKHVDKSSMKFPEQYFRKYNEQMQYYVKMSVKEAKSQISSLIAETNSGDESDISDGESDIVIGDTPEEKKRLCD